MFEKKNIQWLDEQEEKEVEEVKEEPINPIEEPMLEETIIQEPIIQDIELTAPTQAIQMKFPALIIIGGMTESGKTNLLRYILKENHQSFNRIWALCPTADLLVEYQFIPRKFTITNPTEEDVDNILQDQIKFKHLKTCVVLDDCIGSLNFQNSKIFDKLASSSRHFKLTTFILIQDLKKLSPCIRDNAKYLFITKLKEHSLKICYELSSSFKTEKKFKRFMNQVCKNYQVVKFNLTANYNDTPYCMFKPPLVSKFKFSFR